MIRRVQFDVQCPGEIGNCDFLEWLGFQLGIVAELPLANPLSNEEFGGETVSVLGNSLFVAERR